MKIGFDVLKTTGYSGNRAYTTELIKALSQKYPLEQYHLIANIGKSKDIRNIFPQSENLHIHSVIPNPLLLGKSLRPGLKHLNKKILRTSAKHCDLFHATNPINCPQGIKNSVVTLHDLIALRDEPWASAGAKSFYQNVIRQILQQARIIFSVSDYTAQEAMNRFPEITDKLIVTPLAARSIFKQVDKNRKFLETYAIKETHKAFLLYVGEIQPRKNIFALMNSFDKLSHPLQQSLNLIIIGSAKSRKNLEMFHQHRSAMKSRDSIFHLSNVPDCDLVRFYNTAMLFIFPSFYEGFGLPVLEAMSCGCPVITSRTSSLTEVAADAAVTVNPLYEDEMLEAITSLVNDRERRESLQIKGLLRAGQFSWEKTASLTMQGYQQALNR